MAVVSHYNGLTANEYGASVAIAFTAVIAAELFQILAGLLQHERCIELNPLQAVSGMMCGADVMRVNYQAGSVIGLNRCILSESHSVGFCITDEKS